MVITDPVACVSILTKLVKAEFPELHDVSSARLFVYRPGTPLDGLNEDACLKSWDRVPASTGPMPLIVMAPTAAAVTQLGKCL